jgi:Flp pilus assembly protein TadB
VNEQQDVQPWPAWVRYPVIVVLVVVAAYGIATLVTSGTDRAVVRIVVAAVLIPALLLPIQLWGRRRRAERQRQAGPAASDRH